MGQSFQSCDTCIRDRSPFLSLRASKASDRPQPRMPQELTRQALRPSTPITDPCTHSGLANEELPELGRLLRRSRQNPPQPLPLPDPERVVEGIRDDRRDGLGLDDRGNNLHVHLIPCCVNHRGLEPQKGADVYGNPKGHVVQSDKPGPPSGEAVGRGKGDLKAAPQEEAAEDPAAQVLRGGKGEGEVLGLKGREAARVHFRSLCAGYKV